MPEEKNKNEKTIEARASELGLKCLKEAPKEIDKRYSKLIPESIASQHNIFAFGRDGNLIQVAMVDPQDLEARNILSFLAERNKLSFDIYLVDDSVMQQMLGRHQSAEKAVEDVMQSFEEASRERDEDVRKNLKSGENLIIQDAPVSKLVQVIINHAIEGGSSDIHIEPIGEEYRVRFRVDGMLHSSLILPKSVGMATISHIKILSNLKIDETRKPQDGRFKARKGKIINFDDVDFRISTLPVINGEKVAMRILTKDDTVFDLKKLGLLGKNNEVLSRKIKETSGI
ncbi:MAG: hypothetical protein EOM84_02380, partial [Sphingobacteriia bacterium]|nr:hypothetical protein [Sphingobacteriia bacterium]